MLEFGWVYLPDRLFPTFFVFLCFFLLIVCLLLSFLELMTSKLPSVVRFGERDSYFATLDLPHTVSSGSQIELAYVSGGILRSDYVW